MHYCDYDHKGQTKAKYLVTRDDRRPWKAVCGIHLQTAVLALATTHEGPAVVEVVAE